MSPLQAAETPVATGGSTAHAGVDSSHHMYEQPPAGEQPSAHPRQPGQLGNGKPVYYECELERLKRWHPQESRFAHEARRKSSEDGGSVPPLGFTHAPTNNLLCGACSCGH